MPYTITRYQLVIDPQGIFPFVIPDGTIDSTHTTLNLIGRNVLNYGQSLDDNLVWQLENFAGPNPPLNPIIGQEWYDTTDGFMKLYNGTVWVNVGPFSNDNNIINSTTINGNPVLEIVIGGNTVAIWSGSSFTPSPAIPGFASIYAGLNLNSMLTPTPTFNGELTSIGEGVVVLPGLSYTYLLTDRGKVYARSNGGVGMTDTLPNPGAIGIGNGYQVTLINEDPSATLRIFTLAGTIDGSSSLLIPPYGGVTFSTDGINWFSTRGLTGGGESSITVSDGTHFVSNVSNITFSGVTVSGTIPNANVTLNLQTCANIAALRANTNSISQILYVQGYTNQGDGGEGSFWLNSSDHASSDNGGTIIVDASSNRWYRQTGGNPYSVRWFGAKGDNSTNDFTAIRNSQNVAIANNVELIFPTGNYIIGSNLLITSNIIMLKGAILKPSSGILVTITSSITAAPYQIFSFSLGGNVSLLDATCDTWVEWGGAISDALIFGDGQINAGSFILNSATGMLPNSTNWHCAVQGAGSSHLLALGGSDYASLITTIAGGSGGTSCTLANSAVTAVSGAVIMFWQTDNTSAIQWAFNYGSYRVRFAGAGRGYGFTYSAGYYVTGLIATVEHEYIGFTSDGPTLIGSGIAPWAGRLSGDPLQQGCNYIIQNGLQGDYGHSVFRNIQISSIDETNVIGFGLLWSNAQALQYYWSLKNCQTNFCYVGLHLQWFNLGILNQECVYSGYFAGMAKTMPLGGGGVVQKDGHLGTAWFQTTRGYNSGQGWGIYENANDQPYVFDLMTISGGSTVEFVNQAIRLDGSHYNINCHLERIAQDIPIVQSSQTSVNWSVDNSGLTSTQFNNFIALVTRVNNTGESALFPGGAILGNSYIALQYNGATGQLHNFGFNGANGTVDGIAVSDADTSSNLNTAIAFWRNNSQVGSIVENSSSTVYLTSSDYRLKNIVDKVTGALARLRKIKIYRGAFKSEPTKEMDLILAHELSEAIPEAVFGNKDGIEEIGHVIDKDRNISHTNITRKDYLAMKRKKIISKDLFWIKTGSKPAHQMIEKAAAVPLLIAAVQEAEDRIAVLEQQIKSLQVK